MNNYLSQKNQRKKINEPYSSREQILFGVPQSSVLGPILLLLTLSLTLSLSFDIISDLFLIFIETDIASYADGSTLYKTCGNADAIVFKNVCRKAI